MTDLFSNTEDTTLGYWKDYFTPAQLQFLNNINERVDKERVSKVIYPITEQVYRIFQNIHPKDVKVVIVGQDPYHDGNANGFAFGCAKVITPSLNQIFGAIEKDSTLTELRKRLSTADRLDLYYLVNQKVFLLNTVLTVQQGKPNSHESYGYKFFTKAVIQLISRINTNVVFMLWGTNAREYKSLIDSSKHLILENTHPVSASYRNEVWSCNHFSKANEYLIMKGKNKIQWL